MSAVQHSPLSQSCTFSYANVEEIAFEPYLIIIGKSFLWDNLCSEMNGYMERLKQEFPEMPAAVNQFCEELAKCLGDSESNPDPRKTLDLWIAKADECKIKLPEINVLEKF